MAYNLDEIQKLISGALGDDELQNLCLGSFLPVHKEFTSGQTRSERIRMLVEYAERQREIPKLLEAIKEINPNIYAEFEARLVLDNSQGSRPFVVDASVDLPTVSASDAVGVGEDVTASQVASGSRNVMGDCNVVIYGTDAQTIRNTLQMLKPLSIPENLPQSGFVQFVGREQELETLHQWLLRNEQVAVAGMGGVGKTELVLQYALRYKQMYQGGICWLQAREQDVGTQIVQFAKSRLQLHPFEELELPDQVSFCWNYWTHPGEVLVVLDDVDDYPKIKPFLPPRLSRFNVLITTRLRLDLPDLMALDVLNENTALRLLEQWLSEEKLKQELTEAKTLCQRLGCLPLALNLVGRYINRRRLSLANMLLRLEDKGLRHRSMALDSNDRTLTQRVERGVAAAFELSWEELSDAAQKLGCLLSLYALAPIPWSLVEVVNLEQDLEDLEDTRIELENLHLLQGETTYRLHQLIQEFLREKVLLVDRDNVLKREFCRSMVAIAEEIPESPTQSLLLKLEPAIPHIEEVARMLNNYLSDTAFIKPFQGLGRFYEGQELYSQTELRPLSDEEFIKPFQGLGRFYEGRGFYNQAEFWYEQCQILAQQRFGDEHITVATSLNNLAAIRYSRGRYVEAETLHRQALEMRRKLLPEKHSDVADSLNNLALVLKAQGNHEEAEILHVEALGIRRELLGAEHPDTADSLNNLALLYDAQGHYEQAESLLVQAIEIRHKSLGAKHPRIATSLNSLASCYRSQEKFKEAEQMYLQALKLSRELLGEEHYHVAGILNNLAQVYADQQNYNAAVPLLIKSLEIQKRILGDEHPDIATVLNNLASLYEDQNCSTEAESLYIQALEMRQRLLGNNHLYVAISQNNLAKFYHKQGQYEKAKLLYISASAIVQGQLQPNHPIVIKIKENLADLQNSEDD